MLRVLLVFEEFPELTLTETYLKKVGFDVVGIMNEMSIQEQILSFNPDVMVINGKSAKVSSFSVGRKLKENLRYEGKVILVVPKGVRPEVSDLMQMKMDALMESPVQSERLLQILAKFGGQTGDVLIEKLRKARLSDPDLNQKMNLISGKPPVAFEKNKAVRSEKTPSFEDAKRAQKYKQIVSETNIDTKHTNFDKNELKIRQLELKKTWDFNLLEEIDQLKRQFASALFKKK